MVLAATVVTGAVVAATVVSTANIWARLRNKCSLAVVLGASVVAGAVVVAAFVVAAFVEAGIVDVCAEVEARVEGIAEEVSATEVVAESEEVPAAEVEARAEEGAAVVDGIEEETVVVCNEVLVETKLIDDCTVCSVDEACAAVASELVIGGVEAALEDDITLCSVEVAAAVESTLVGGAVEADEVGGCVLAGKLEVAGPGVEASVDSIADVNRAAVVGGAG